MTDFLLLHSPAHGAWSWDGVKGILEDALRREGAIHHPMYTPGTVSAPELDGASGGRTTLDERVEEVLRQASAAGLKRPVVVLHALSGLLGLEVVRRMADRPQALVLVGAVVPDAFHTVSEMLPLLTQYALLGLRLLPGRRPPGTVRLHRELVLKLMCNDLTYAQASYTLGRLGPLPLGALDTLPDLDSLEPRCPVTYLVLRRDRLVPAGTQRRMAAALPGATVVELDGGHEAPTFHADSVAQVALDVADGRARAAA